MTNQCDQHRRDHDKAVVARHIAHIKQAKRNKREWLRRAADACRKGDIGTARALLSRADHAMGNV